MCSKFSESSAATDDARYDNLEIVSVSSSQTKGFHWEIFKNKK